MNNIKLANNLSIPVLDYASQGNAILGIRDSGKSYSALKSAEELLDNGIPIVAFDPVGIWRHLKTGINKNKGYQVVVAGGNYGDLELKPETAGNIVRAAMKENISLIIDLYSTELANKSKWIRIVQESIDILMYENNDYGLRHIFLEEAAEFIPQRLQPQHSRVYSSIERLARMGRNARLGYTLINQRAEEVNKAILEISTFSLLHKQIGKNSLLSIKKWLELKDVKDLDKIIKSLNHLQQGECWAVGFTEEPKLIKILPRKTYHPNPKDQILNRELTVNKNTVDVSKFVETMKKRLAPKPEPKAVMFSSTPKGLVKQGVDVAKGRDKSVTILLEKKDGEIKFLKQINTIYTTNEKEHIKQIEQLRKIIININGISGVNFSPIPNSDEAIKVLQNEKPAPAKSSITFGASGAIPKQGTSKVEVVYKDEIAGDTKLYACQRRMLKFLATKPDRAFTKVQICFVTGYMVKSSGVRDGLSKLNSLGYIQKVDNRIQVNTERLSEIQALLAGVPEEDYSFEGWIRKLYKCQREMFQLIYSHPEKIFTKNEIAEATAYQPGSSSVRDGLSKLCSLDFIKRPQTGEYQLNTELLDI